MGYVGPKVVCSRCGLTYELPDCCECEQYSDEELRAMLSGGDDEDFTDDDHPDDSASDRAQSSWEKWRGI